MTETGMNETAGLRVWGVPCLFRKLPNVGGVDGTCTAFAGSLDNSTHRHLALKIFDWNHICIGECLQNSPLPCSSWGGGVILQEDEGEEEDFGLVHPYQSSHEHPCPCCPQNSAALCPWQNPVFPAPIRAKFERRITLGGKQSSSFSWTAGNFAAFNHAAHLTSLPFQSVQTNCSTKGAIGREYSGAALGCSAVIGHITHMVSFPFWWEEGRNLLHADT